MGPNKEKALIISLIKDDIINYKLVNGLHYLGLDSLNYFLHLSQTIFERMGIKGGDDSDEIYERYMALTKRAQFFDISESHQRLDDLALEIYMELLARKLKC